MGFPQPTGGGNGGAAGPGQACRVNGSVAEGGSPGREKAGPRGCHGQDL